MKIFVAAVLALGSVSALGSGPYLPSGWKPQGPAFNLPGEVQKPVDNPLKETILLEVEASGSDSLREYGPPKAVEVSQNVVNQGLPDAVTEQTFFVVQNEINSAVEESVTAAVEESVKYVEVESVTEVNAKLKSEVEIATESLFVTAEEQTTETYARIADIELQTDVPTVSYEADVESAKSEEIQSTVASVEEKLEQVVVKEVETVEEVKNIAEAIVNIENEIKSEQVQKEAVVEVKVTQEGSGSAQAPEGFLEYGPPGFREYGPPKGDEILRSAAVVQEPSNSISAENNELRRRRFSPKFRTTKNKRLH